jgi:hypothetical protein
MLPFVLYGCETWLLTLKEECRLRVFDNGVLRRVFGPKRDEVTGERRRLRNEKLNALNFSQNISWVIKLKGLRWAGHVARTGSRGAYSVSVRKMFCRNTLFLLKF